LLYRYKDKSIGEKRANARSLQTGLAGSSAQQHFSVMSQALNDKQVDLLRYLHRQASPVSAADLDGRIVRALKSRDCIEEHNGRVMVTDSGRAVLEGGAVPRKRQRRIRAEQGASHARAKAIRRAIELLEMALPKEAEVAVGNMFAYADDVVDGFRKYARALEKKKSERPAAE
jgi:hypothetical protein